MIPRLYSHSEHPDNLVFWFVPKLVLISNSAAPSQLRCVHTIESEIKKVDQQYDLCNEAWARGEADKFKSQELLDFNSL